MDEIIGMYDVVELRNPSPKWAGHTFQVVPSNRRANIAVKDLATGAELFGKPHIFKLVRKGTQEERDATYRDIVEKLEVAAQFEPGMVVTVPGGLSHRKWNYAAGQLFVVTKRADRIGIAKLGGDNGLGWTLPADKLQIHEIPAL